MPNRIVWDVPPSETHPGRVDELRVEDCTVQMSFNGFGYQLTITRPDGTQLLGRIENHGRRPAVVPVTSLIPFDQEDR